ncbi:hypothetical protein [Pseudomonas sp. 31 R 17]|uniref:hypothetical protein n=1 Tax=Pseudomonas TaxID=286 RepID=UPI000811E08F|nr:MULTISPECIES: hypothetical protein [unclassified Pseudomonas]CRM61119.1 hypothetical protein [Pseudomonas sp. 31 R 17]CRM98622.1 hypothetical protein [Pseudomonas sp. 34 E 7]
MTNHISIGAITTPNPTLFVDMATLDATDPDAVEYLIQTQPPGSNWFYVNQFCSLLTTYWLNDPNSPQVYGLSNLVDAVKITAAGQLITLLGLDSQTKEAQLSIANASVVLPAAFVTALPTYPAGTKIWAGNNVHVLGFLITPSTTPGADVPLTYTAYDSNIGVVQLGLLLADLPQRLTKMGYTSLVVGVPA